MKLLQGNAQTSLLLLRILGLLGAAIGIAAHFGNWHTIQTTPKDIVHTGLEDMGMIGIGILAIYALLLSLNSIYAILLAVVFFPYMLEQVVGLNLLRYMPLATTKLHTPLYLFLPMAAVLLLIGSFAPILRHFQAKS